MHSQAPAEPPASCIDGGCSVRHPADGSTTSRRGQSLPSYRRTAGRTLFLGLLLVLTPLLCWTILAWIAGTRGVALGVWGHPITWVAIPCGVALLLISGWCSLRANEYESEWRSKRTRSRPR